MIKKLVLTTAAVAGGIYAVDSFYHGSVGTIWKRTRTAVERSISPEFELARIKDQISQLAPDMQRNISKIAEEMVEVRTLETRLGDLKDRLVKEQKDLQVYTDATENKATLVSTSGRTFTPTNSMVKDRVRTCKNIEREVGNVQKILDAKQSGLDAARQQLAEMKRQKDELTTLAAEFEAELKTLQLEQTRAKLKLDDTRLGQIKESFESLRARIEVERKKTELAGQFQSNSLLEDKPKAESAKEALDEAKEYLAGSKDKAESAKK